MKTCSVRMAALICSLFRSFKTSIHSGTELLPFLQTVHIIYNDLEKIKLLNVNKLCKGLKR